MAPETLVTVIVTPRERYSVAQRMLETFVANTAENHRLIYVAGGAPSAIQEYLKGACSRPGCELILHKDFLPCNVARNLGLTRVKTKYVVFLENDVMVEPGWLAALLRCAEEEKADFVGPLCLEGEPAEGRVHSLGGMLLVESAHGETLVRERHHLGPICLRTAPQRLVRLPADFAEMHCALVRRSVFDQIGPLDERIIAADEHLDLALHQRALHCRGFSEPKAVVSYLAADYTVGDLDTYALRWSAGWYFPTMTHFARKWALPLDSPMFRDSVSSFYQIRERCLLRQELAAPPSAIKEGLAVAQTIVRLLDQMEALGYPRGALERVRDAYAVATELFATCFRASGRTLLAHLVGTGGILAAFGANPALIASAVLHAAYELGQFPGKFGESHDAMRRWMKRRAGERVEALVHAYSRLQLSEVDSYCTGDLDSMPIGLANVVMLRVANGIENRLSGDFRYFDSTQWLEHSNALIGTWMPRFTAIAERLGMGGMVAILKETLAGATSDPEVHSLRPSRPLNYRIDLADPNRGMHPLLPRTMPTAPSGFGARSSGTAPAADSASIPIPTSAVVPANEGLVERKSKFALLHADPRPWAYSGCVRLDGLVDAKGPATIEVRLQVETGTMGVLLLQRGSSSVPIVPEQSASRGEPVVLHFEIPAIEEAGELTFRSWPSEQGQARARISAMNVFLADPNTKQAAGS